MGKIELQAASEYIWDHMRQAKINFRNLPNLPKTWTEENISPEEISFNSRQQLGWLLIAKLKKFGNEQNNNPL